MQKHINVDGRKYHLRGMVSPTAIIEAVGVQHGMVQAAACIGLACAAGDRLPSLGAPNANMHQFGREVADKLIGAGWSVADVVRVGHACSTHLMSLLPSHALPSQSEVDAAAAPLDEGGEESAP